MIVGVPREIAPGDRRVALVPEGAAALQKNGLEVLFETGAGEAAGYPDAAYRDKGARLAAHRDELFDTSDVLLTAGFPAIPGERRAAEIARLHGGQTLIGVLNPLGDAALAEALAARGVTSFALELLPRITRAQSMDVLSSMALVAGYKAVLLAASALPRLFPMFMTAAGTLTPARVFVIGAGVAGLQAIATARRLGAVVHAYDVRAAVRQEVESLGGKFVELPLETAEGTGGYARAMDEAFYARQRELMKSVVTKSDVVITTAAIPGKKAPVLVTRDMLEGMPPGSVVVDLAADSGGNCELTRAGETVTHQGVMILGPVNLPATVPYHASQMYSKNISTFLLSLVKDGQLTLDLDDEIVRDTLITQNGEVVHHRVREALGLPAQTAVGGSR